MYVHKYYVPLFVYICVQDYPGMSQYALYLLILQSRYLSHALDEMRAADFCLDYGNPGVLNRHFYNVSMYSAMDCAQSSLFTTVQSSLPPTIYRVYTSTTTQPCLPPYYVEHLCCLHNTFHKSHFFTTTYALWVCTYVHTHDSCLVTVAIWL